MSNTMSTPTVGASQVNRVELSLAADAQMLFLARMTVAAVASRANFAYEEVEDLRLAIDELCIRLMGSSTGVARISLLFQWSDDGTLDVMGTRIPAGGPSTNGHHPHPDGSGPALELSERILDALVEEHGADMIGTTHRAWFRMRRQGHPG